MPSSVLRFAAVFLTLAPVLSSARAAAPPPTQGMDAVVSTAAASPLPDGAQCVRVEHALFNRPELWHVSAAAVETAKIEARKEGEKKVGVWSFALQARNEMAGLGTPLYVDEGAIGLTFLIRRKAGGPMEIQLGCAKGTSEADAVLRPTDDWQRITLLFRDRVPLPAGRIELRAGAQGDSPAGKEQIELADFESLYPVGTRWVDEEKLADFRRVNPAWYRIDAAVLASRVQAPLNRIFGTGVHFDPDARRHWNAEADLGLIGQAGLGWVRDTVSWRQIEPRPGVYQLPDDLKPRLALAHEKGLRVLLILHKQNDEYLDVFDPAAYAKAAAFLASSLDGCADGIEILNEPFLSSYARFYGGTWNGKGPSPWIRHYHTLLVQAADAIKRSNPRMLVIGLGGNPEPANLRIISLGLPATVDAVSLHPYGFRYPPEMVPYFPRLLDRDGLVCADEEGSLESLVGIYRTALARFGAKQEIWFTEWGYPNHLGGDESLYMAYTPEASAQYTTRRMAESLRLGVDASFQYDFQDDFEGEPGNPEAHFGLVGFHLDPKPAYRAVSVFLHAIARYGRVALPGADFAARAEEPASGSPPSVPTCIDRIFAVALQGDDGGQALLLWSGAQAAPDRPARRYAVTLPASFPRGAARVTDLVDGRESSVDISGSGLHLAIPPHPILIEPSGVPKPSQ